MRSLEDALAILQVNTSTQPHPLLTKIWTTEEADSGSNADATSTPAHSLINALGSLHLDGNPQTDAACFFGPSGGSEVRTRHFAHDTRRHLLEP